MNEVSGVKQDIVPGTSWDNVQAGATMVHETQNHQVIVPTPVKLQPPIAPVEQIPMQNMEHIAPVAQMQPPVQVFFFTLNGNIL